MKNDDLATRCKVESVNRRGFLRATLTATAALQFTESALSNQESPPATAAADDLIDTHVYLGRWPFARLPGDEPSELVALLRRSKVSQAWAGTFEGLLHKDIGGANLRLLETCRRGGEGMLIPFGTVNPMLPDWEEELRRCHEVFRMPGIRLHPTFHGYSLADPCFTRLLAIVADRKLIVQVVAWLEDGRPTFLSRRQQQMNLEPLKEKLAPLPGLRLIVYGGLTTAADKSFRILASTKNVYWDVSRLQPSERLSEILNFVSADRLLFGSNSPLLDFEIATRNLNDPLLEAEFGLRIRKGTARQLIAGESARAKK